MKVWNSKKSTADDILELIEGRYCAGMFGQSVQPQHSVEAAEALVMSADEIKIYSQAQAIVKAQELGLTFQDWMELSLFS